MEYDCYAQGVILLRLTARHKDQNSLHPSPQSPIHSDNTILIILSTLTISIILFLACYKSEVKYRFHQ